MRTFDSILNKKIFVEFQGQQVNSYKITKIIPTERFMVGLKGEGNGRIYNCVVDWEKKTEGSYSELDFDEETLDGLADKGYAVCPSMSNLRYRMDGVEIKTVNYKMN
jgi:hypothetical protein